MKTLIFDSNAAHLQWISSREIFLEALEEFNAGLGPHKRGLDLEPAHWTFYRVTDEKAKEVADAAATFLWHRRLIPIPLSIGD